MFLFLWVIAAVPWFSESNQWFLYDLGGTNQYKSIQVFNLLIYSYLYNK